MTLAPTYAPPRVTPMFQHNLQPQMRNSCFFWKQVLYFYLISNLTSIAIFVLFTTLLEPVFLFHSLFVISLRSLLLQGQSRTRARSANGWCLWRQSSPVSVKRLLRSICSNTSQKNATHTNTRPPPPHTHNPPTTTHTHAQACAYT